MQQTKPSRPAKRPARHFAPRVIAGCTSTVFTGLSKPYVGLSDGRIYDPRTGCALDWWGTGPLKFHYDDDLPGIWHVVFSDGVALCMPECIYVGVKPETGQFRVEEPLEVRSMARRLRREVQGGRRPVTVKGVPEACPLLMSMLDQPQQWPPPAPEDVDRSMRLNAAQRRASAVRYSGGW